MNLFRYEDKPIRLTTVDGDVFEGVARTFPSAYGLHEYDREEESIQLGMYMIFESQIGKIEPLDPEKLCGFFGAEFVPESIRELYRDLEHVWCAETCAPRMRQEWSAENPTLGQCSITAFLVQDLFGGKVFGVPLPEGGVHCYNQVNDHIFDLTSEQFGDEELDYIDNPEQFRETHFADADKYARYELLKRRLEEYRESGS